MSRVELVLRSRAAKGSGNPRRIGTWGSGNTAAGNGCKGRFIGSTSWSTQSTYRILSIHIYTIHLSTSSEHRCCFWTISVSNRHTTWQPCFTLARENSFAFCLIPPRLVSPCFNHRFKHSNPDFGSIMLGWEIEHVPPARRPGLQHFATMVAPCCHPLSTTTNPYLNHSIAHKVSHDQPLQTIIFHHSPPSFTTLPTHQ